MIEYLPLDPPRPGEVIQVVDGVRWVRMPLPFRLDHVNLWLLDGPDGLTIVDAGVADAQTLSAWRQVLRTLAPGEVVRRVLVTHHHPDHCGAAGWLAGMCDAPFAMSRSEWLSVQFYLRQDDSSLAVSDEFYRCAGGQPSAFEDGGVAFASYLSAFPAIYNRLVDGGLLGAPRDRAWRVMTFGGHAPELVCLHDAAAGVLIATDQVLPHISPMIGMVPQEPDDDPLGEYLGSLKRLIQLPAGTIVLPSHGRPFRGLHDRLNDLMIHHQERLDTLLGCIDGEHNAALLSARLFPKVDSAVHRAFALSETLAHLRYLEKADTVRRSTDTCVEYFRLAGSA